MKRTKSLKVSIGKYTNREGKERNKYVEIGSILEDGDGKKLMLLNRTFNPAGVPNPENRDAIIVAMFDVEEERKDFTKEPEGYGDVPF